MSKTIVISRTLTTLSPDSITSSSQSYELQLAFALSGMQPTTVVALSAQDDLSSGGVNLVALNTERRGFRSAANLAKELIRSRSRGAQVLGFGYDPLMVIVLALARMTGATTYTTIFDTHRGSTENFAPVKRTLANIYFGLGRRLLGALSGVIVVTESAEEIFSRFNRNVFRTRIGFRNESRPLWSRPAAKEFNLIYAGSLETYNGVQQLMDGVIIRNARHQSSPSMSLNLYGTGTLRPIVESYAARFSAINYHGVVPQAEVKVAVLKSNLAFNLRDMKHPVSGYAFPSKLIELWGSGVPVASSGVLPPAVLSQYALIVADLTPESIAEALEHAEKSYDALMHKAELAKGFVAAKYDWHDIASEMLDFMSQRTRSGKGI